MEGDAGVAWSLHAGCKARAEACYGSGCGEVSGGETG